MRVLPRRRLLGKHRRRQDALDQVVVALKVDAPPGADRAGEEERLQRHLAFVPVPHLTRRRALALVAGVSRTHRTLCPHQLERLRDQLLLLCQHAPHPRPDAMALVHAPAEQRVVLDRDQRRLMRPVLDQATIDTAAAVSRDSIEQPAVVGAEPREQRHVMGPGEDVYRVQLEQTEAADRGGERGQARLPASGPGAEGEALSRQRNATGRGQAQPYGSKLLADVFLWHRVTARWLPLLLSQCRPRHRSQRPPIRSSDFDIVPRAGLVFAGIILVALIVVVATGGLSAFECIHVVSGPGWTVIDSIPRVHHAADPRRSLIPRAHRVHDEVHAEDVVLMPSIVTATLVEGSQLSTISAPT